MSKMNLDDKKYSKYFKAIGDSSRLKIIAILTTKELTVNDIVSKMNLSQSTISRHLSVLKEADIVSDRRDGQNVFYSLNKIVVNDCCADFCDCLDIMGRKLKKRKKS